MVRRKSATPLLILSSQRAAFERHDERTNLALVNDMLDIILGFRSLTDVAQFAFLDFQKGVDHRRVEVRADMGGEFFARLLIGSGGAIRAVAGDGVKGIGDREDAGVDMYLLAAQAKRVAAAV